MQLQMGNFVYNWCASFYIANAIETMHMTTILPLTEVHNDPVMTQRRYAVANTLSP